MEKYLLPIFIPMILSNIIHMILVKKNTFSSLAIPISRPLFGANKTWRGFVLLPLLNGFFFWMVNLFLPLFGNLSAFFYGAVLGLAYMVFELPNSWLKRNMGIASGQKATKHAWFFMMLDKMDSALGVSLTSKFIFHLGWLDMIKIFLLAVGIHLFFSWLLTILGLKKQF